MANSEAIPNVNLLLQLLTNPTALQQATTTITTQNQQISSAPTPPIPTISTPSNALIGVINTSVNIYNIIFKKYDNINNNV